MHSLGRNIFSRNGAQSLISSPAASLKAKPLGYPQAVRCISVEAMKLNSPLSVIDEELHSIIKREQKRLTNNVCLIASENFAPRYVMDALGSVMTNKYSEGYPGARYYGGTQHIDESEILCTKRALEAFRLNPEKWGVNVQMLSGAPANFAVYTALLNVHDRIMGLDLPHGGHLSHGFQTPTKKISAVSKYFESIPYKLNTETGLIDYDELEKFAERIQPKLIVAGFSAYSRNLDFPRFRQICDKVGAILLADMAHISGLVAADVVPGPFEHADIVTTTTHKSLRGPRGSMIFFRKGLKGTDSKGNAVYYNYEDKINWAVFPGLQGGPHEHTIAALSVALKEAKSEEFRQYQLQVKANASALGAELLKRGFNLVSGGTDNHLLLVDLRSKGLSGAKMDRLCEEISITLNKNTIPSDKSAMNPSGVRIGSPAMTSRGLVEEDFKEIGRFIDAAVQVGVEIQKETGPKLGDFVKHVTSGSSTSALTLKKEIEAFASQFPTVGYEKEV